MMVVAIMNVNLLMRKQIDFTSSIGCCLFTLIWQFNKTSYTTLHWPLHEWLGKVWAWMAENPLSVLSSNLFVPFFPWYIYFSKLNAMMPCLFDFVCNHKASPYSVMYSGTGKPHLHWMWDHSQMMRLESWD